MPITFDAPMLAPAVYILLPMNARAVLPPQPAAQFGSELFPQVDQLMYSRITPLVGLICVIGELCGVLVGVTPPHCAP